MVLIVGPQILHFDFGEEPVNSGDLASLTCSVFKGDLPVNITWYHNNQNVHYSDGILVSNAGKKISTLSIDSVQAEHAGTYTCVAENRAGKFSYSAELLVNGTFICFVSSFFFLSTSKYRIVFQLSRKFYHLVSAKIP